MQWVHLGHVNHAGGGFAGFQHHHVELEASIGKRNFQAGGARKKKSAIRAQVGRREDSFPNLQDFCSQLIQ